MGNRRETGLSFIGIALLAVLALISFAPEQAFSAELTGGNIYTQEIQPLTLEDCARCYTSHYN